MISGGGKQKGASFEREVCVKLSLWATAGAKKDCFWRSAMSGGRATLSARKGTLLHRQAGDITATAPEGHPLTGTYYIEAKHYKSLELTSFVLSGTGVLAQFWREAELQAGKHAKMPLVVAKQNQRPTLVLLATDDKWLRKQLYAHALGGDALISSNVGWTLGLFDRLLALPWPWPMIHD